MVKEGHSRSLLSVCRQIYGFIEARPHSVEMEEGHPEFNGFCYYEDADISGPMTISEAWSIALHARKRLDPGRDDETHWALRRLSLTENAFCGRASETLAR